MNLPHHPGRRPRSRAARPTPALLVEPLTSVYLAANPTAKQVAKASVITDRSSFFIATKDALGDKAKAAALADYIARLVRGFQYTSAHPDEVAQAVYVDQYKLPLDRGARDREAERRHQLRDPAG